MVMHRIMWEVAANDSLRRSIDGLLLIGDGDRVPLQGGQSYGSSPDGKYAQGITWQFPAADTSEHRPRKRRVPDSLVGRFHSVCDWDDVVCDAATAWAPGLVNTAAGVLVHTEHYKSSRPVRNAVARIVEKSRSRAAVPPMQIDASVPTFEVGHPYTGKITATGGADPYTYGIGVGDQLPPGLVLDETTGAISGTPTTWGKWALTVNTRDANGRHLTRDINPNSVAPPSGPEFATSELPHAAVGVHYNTTLALTDLRRGTWVVADGALPTGPTLDYHTGQLVGWPAGPVEPASFTIRFTDDWNQSTSQTLTLTVDPPPDPVTTLPYLLRSATVGVPYRTYARAVNAHGPVTFQPVTPLPEGLQLLPSPFAETEWMVQGTPGTPGEFTFEVEVDDGRGSAGPVEWSLVVSPAPTTSTLQAGVDNISTDGRHTLRTGAGGAPEIDVETGAVDRPLDRVVSAPCGDFPMVPVGWSHNLRWAVLRCGNLGEDDLPIGPPNPHRMFRLDVATGGVETVVWNFRDDDASPDDPDVMPAGSASIQLSSDGERIFTEGAGETLSEAGDPIYQRFYVHDLSAGSSVIVRPFVSWTTGEQPSVREPTFSADGKYVTVERYDYGSGTLEGKYVAQAAVPIGDVNGPCVPRCVTKIMSHDYGGYPPGYSGDLAGVSDDGLAILVARRQVDDTMRLEVIDQSTQGRGFVSDPLSPNAVGATLSGDGRTVAYPRVLHRSTSEADQRWLGDVGTMVGVGDGQWVAGPTIGTPDPALPYTGGSTPQSMSFDGSAVVFVSSASNLVPDPRPDDDGFNAKDHYLRR